MILIGTSGFSYDDWEGAFYPSALSKRDRLSYYAQRFPSVEVNSTYYAIPAPATFATMAAKTPESFLFVVKANREMTHVDDPSPDTFAAFIRSIDPLREAGKLGCVLAQYPWGFKPHDGATDRLHMLRQEMADIPTVVEFRNSEWVTDETFDLLRELGLGFCCVDEPALRGLMPRVVRATSSIGYVRFHGRNAAKWWKHDYAWQRYDYLYAEDELAEWVPRIDSLVSQTDTTYLFFNNHYKGKSAQNAKMLASMLSVPIGDDRPEQAALFD